MNLHSEPTTEEEHQAIADTDTPAAKEPRTSAKGDKRKTRPEAVANEAPGETRRLGSDEVLPGKGKIARLPHKIREELNQKLRDGEKGPVLLKWLNSLPEARKMLRDHFDGQPIAKDNLSRWVHNGYQSWLSKQEAFEQVRLTLEEAEQFKGCGPADLSERVAVWLCLRCAQEAQRLGADAADVDLALLGRLCRSLTSLRRGDHSVRRLALEEARLQLEQQTRPGSKQMEKLFWEWTERPDIREKLFPRPPTPEEQMREYKIILGMDPDAELPAERYRREQREKQAAQIQSRNNQAQTTLSEIKSDETCAEESLPEL